jgi:glycerophosphoryl diester phosphodiesterase
MSHKILTIGHRGAKGHVTENTLESVEKALSLGVDGIEIDVHLCASGELVVFHDFTVDRMTDGTGEISKFKLKELKNLKVKSRFQIPTLSQVLLLVNNRCLVNIELKGLNTAKETCRLIEFFVTKKGWDYNNFLVSSFQEDLLETVYKTNKQIPIGVLAHTNLERTLKLAKTIKAKSVIVNYTMLTKDIVENIKENYQVIAFTVNNLKPIERIKAYEVDGIITDFPDRVC